MDARIGYPNEHLAGDSDSVLSSPSYATAVGLLMEGLRKDVEEEVIETQPEEVTLVNEVSEEEILEEKTVEKEYKAKEKSKSIFEKFTEKFKEFLDNAEYK